MLRVMEGRKKDLVGRESVVEVMSVWERQGDQVGSSVRLCNVRMQCFVSGLQTPP